MANITKTGTGAKHDPKLRALMAEMQKTGMKPAAAMPSKPGPAALKKPGVGAAAQEVVRKPNVAQPAKPGMPMQNVTKPAAINNHVMRKGRKANGVVNNADEYRKHIAANKKYR